MGKLHITYIDVNPNSPTYNQTSSVTIDNSDICDINSEPNWTMTGSFCETGLSGKTGNLITYYQDTNEHSATYGQISSVTEANEDCAKESGSTEAYWKDSGDSWCELSDNGENTGYKVKFQYDAYPYSSTYMHTRNYRAKSNDCMATEKTPHWTDISSTCNIVPFNCSLVYDGTANVLQIDDNPNSATFNATRTINRQDLDKCPTCGEFVIQYKWQKVSDGICGGEVPQDAVVIDKEPTDK